MKQSYLLFSHKMKMIGWIIFIPSLILGILHLIFEFEVGFFDTRVIALLNEPIPVFKSAETSGFVKIIKNNILDELLASGIIAGGLIAAFSREKIEDEMVSKLRLDSLVWAVYINYGVLLFAVVFMYDFTFYYVMIANMFTVIVFFLMRYEWMKYRMKKQAQDEE